MVNVNDVPADVFIDTLKEDLKKDLKQPEWTKFVKTGVSRERAPTQKDWWYARAASLLRKIYLNGPVGIQRLRTIYGGKKNMGVKPEREKRGSGKILRVLLHDFEKLGYIKKVEKKGRIITQNGQKYLDKLAFDSYKTWKEKREKEAKTEKEAAALRAAAKPAVKTKGAIEDGTVGLRTATLKKEEPAKQAAKKEENVKEVKEKKEIPAKEEPSKEIKEKKESATEDNTSGIKNTALGSEGSVTAGHTVGLRTATLKGEKK